ncbi:hypothetical protein RR46_11722 [Papilio xuthus]|uniref:Uncharacterized protein n=1 Tax=Papilio xuthus TaxID=66420 RepID=A0A194PTC0_PAPXU|nr:hypothetical protein RR46_11722 [Papilio xuthus]
MHHGPKSSQTPRFDELSSRMFDVLTLRSLPINNICEGGNKRAQQMQYDGSGRPLHFRYDISVKNAANCSYAIMPS